MNSGSSLQSSAGAGNNSAAANPEQRGAGATNKVIVDKGRNALIFQGSAEEYAQFRTLVEQMDRAPLEVLIEATVAEVTLKQGETLGAVFEFDDGAAAKVSRSSIKSSDSLLVSLIRDFRPVHNNVACACRQESCQYSFEPACGGE